MADHDDILIALRRITRAIDLRSRQLLKETGLTAPQLVVIQTLRRHGPMPASALARQVSLSQATISTILDRLGKADLVSRARGDADRRIVTVTLTDKGKDSADSAPELLQAGFMDRLEKLEDWERHMLVAALQRIAAMMDAGDIDASPFLEVGDIVRN